MASVSGAFKEGGQWTATASSFSGNQTVSLSADVNPLSKVRTADLTISAAGVSKSCTVSLTQEASVFEAELTIVAIPAFAAGGGTYDSRTGTGHIVVKRNGVVIDDRDIRPVFLFKSGASVSWITFSATNTSFTVADRALESGGPRSVTIRAQYTINAGGDNTLLECDVPISQAANFVETVSVSDASFAYSTIAAKGATVTPTTDSTIAVTMSSGSTLSSASAIDGYTYTLKPSFSMANGSGFTLNSTTTGSLTATSMGTTLGSRQSPTITYSLSLTYTPSSELSALGAKTVSGSDSSTGKATQGVNEVTSSILKVTVFNYPKVVSAAGGTSVAPNITVEKDRVYTSGATDSVSVTTYTKTFSMVDDVDSGATVDTSTGLVTFPSRGTTVGVMYTTQIGLVVSADGLSVNSQAGCRQDSNIIESFVVMDISFDWPQFSPAGESHLPTHVGRFIQATYSSGVTGERTPMPDGYYVSAESAVYSLAESSSVFTIVDASTGEVSAANMGRTLGSRTSPYIWKDITITLTAREWAGGSVADLKGTGRARNVANQGVNAIGFRDLTITSFAYSATPTVAASGGTSVPTLAATETQFYTSGTVDENIPVPLSEGSFALTTSGHGASVNSSTGVVTYASRGSVTGDAWSDSVTWTLNYHSNSTSKSASVSQEANLQTLTGIRLAAPSVSGDSWISDWSAVPAAGGNLACAGYNQYSYTSGSTNEVRITDFSDVTVNTSVSWVEVLDDDATYPMSLHVLSRGAIAGDARSSDVSWTHAGFTSNSLSFMQVANVKTFTKIVARSTSSNPPTGIPDIDTRFWVAANGGVLTVSFIAKYSYSSGSSSEDVVSSGVSTEYYMTSPSATWDSANQTMTYISAGTGVSPVVYTAIHFTYNELTGTTSFGRQANEATYAVPVLTLSYSDIAASGGSVTPSKSFTQSVSYTSGSTSTVTSGGTWSYSGTSVNTSTGAVSASSLGTTVKSRSKITTATASLMVNGKTGSTTADVYQAANSATYGAVTISGGTVADIPASGGSVSSASGISGSQTVSFTSGDSRPGTVSFSYSTAVSAPSLGTTFKSRTLIGTLDATAIGDGGVSATKSFDVYQEANSRTWGTPTITTFAYRGTPAVNTLSAGADNRNPTLLATQTGTWTSGETETASLIRSKTFTGGDVNTSTGNYTVTSLGNVVTARKLEAAITVNITMNGKTASDSLSLYREANEVTYSDPIVTHTSPISVAASAGSYTLSPNFTQRAYYTSGSETPILSGSFTYAVKTALTGFSVNSGGLVSYTANPSVSARNGFVVTITGSGNGKSGTTDVTFNQAGAEPTIQVSLNGTSYGSSVTVNLEGKSASEVSVYVKTNDTFDVS